MSHYVNLISKNTVQATSLDQEYHKYSLHF